MIQHMLLRILLVVGSLLLAGIVVAPQAVATQAVPGGIREPATGDALRQVLALFNTHQVVGMNSAHRMKDLDDFILALVRHPAFPDAVDDIVVECGNSQYQAVLDRYIAGENVSLAEARQVWRNTTQPMCSVSAFYEQLFPLIRRINERLPAAGRLRVIAADPPIDWAAVKSAAEVKTFVSNRDVSIAGVMEKEVLAKRRKALMLFGVSHLHHSLAIPAAGVNLVLTESAVAKYEKTYPGVTFVIDLYAGPACGGAPSATPALAAFEARMASLPVPSLVPTEDSGLPFAGRFDAYLYLGPRDLLLTEYRPASIFVDTEFMAELQRREPFLATGINDQTNPDKVRDADASPFLYCR
jgi:hypothetical protein